jgi:hypothetical protein
MLYKVLNFVVELFFIYGHLVYPMQYSSNLIQKGSTQYLVTSDYMACIVFAIFMSTF